MALHPSLLVQEGQVTSRPEGPFRHNGMALAMAWS